MNATKEDERSGYVALNLAVAMAVTLYGFLKHSGPFRVIAGLQDRVFGAHELNITLLMSLLAVYVPLTKLRPLMERRFGALTLSPAMAAKSRASRRFLLDWSGRVAFAGLCLIVLSAFFWFRGATRGELLPYSVAEAERGVEPPSNFVRVADAKPRTDPWRWKEGSNYESYFPAKPVSGRGTERAHLVVRVDGSYASFPEGADITGFVEYRGLPAQVQVSLLESGQLAEKYYVLRAGFDPRSDQNKSRGMGALGLVLFVVGLEWARKRGLLSVNNV